MYSESVSVTVPRAKRPEPNCAELWVLSVREREREREREGEREGEEEKNKRQKRAREARGP